MQLALASVSVSAADDPHGARSPQRCLSTTPELLSLESKFADQCHAMATEGQLSAHYVHRRGAAHAALGVPDSEGRRHCVEDTRLVVSAPFQSGHGRSAVSAIRRH